jgi:hypothetical protein
MKFNKPLIASVIVGAISLILGFIFIGIVVQTVTNSQLGGATSTAANWASYTAANSLVTLVPLFNALLMIIVAVVVAIGFLKAVGMV